MEVVYCDSQDIFSSLESLKISLCVLIQLRQDHWSVFTIKFYYSEYSTTVLGDIISYFKKTDT